jgi:hypothetical protein
MAAHIKLSTEDYARVMGPRRYYAVKMDARTKFKLEECAEGMGQRGNYVVWKDAQMLLREEECARGMEQKDDNILLNGMHKPCLKRGECMRHADKVQGQSM